MGEIEALAESVHEAWRASRPREAKPSPNDVLFPSLPEEKKESNRSSVRSTVVALAALGYRLVRFTPGTPSVLSLPVEQHEPLKRLEHDRWLREVLQTGWAYGKPSEPETPP